MSDAELISQPCQNPAATMVSTLQALAAANAAKRLELDWRAQNKVQLPVYMPIQCTLLSRGLTSSSESIVLIMC